ncbi:MAG: phage tail tape measure protein [Anaerolineae bacterium]|nr:phage tail tape measure protein [Anaerolineae bacterium]
MSSFGTSLSLGDVPCCWCISVRHSWQRIFQDSLTEIQARTGLTNEAMEEVRQTALRLGADTMFSTQQASDAFLQLLTAGLDLIRALAALPAILDGAAASGSDLGTAADLVTNVMSAFNLEAAGSRTDC